MVLYNCHGTRGHHHAILKTPITSDPRKPMVRPASAYPGRHCGGPGQRSASHSGSSSDSTRRPACQIATGHDGQPVSGSRPSTANIGLYGRTPGRVPMVWIPSIMVRRTGLRTGWGILCGFSWLKSSSRFFVDHSASINTWGCAP